MLKTLKKVNIHDERDITNRSKAYGTHMGRHKDYMHKIIFGNN
jgi:hypothetical protein